YRHIRHLHSFPTRRSSDLGSRSVRERTHGNPKVRVALRVVRAARVAAVSHVVKRGECPDVSVKMNRLDVRVPHGESQVLGYEKRSEEHTSELQSLRHLVCR